jgi:hypothetical protein
MTSMPMTSPLLDRPGAVAGEGADAGVAAHYGDPMREQRLLAEGLAVVDLSHRGVVTVTGPDRLTWLHSMTTQHLTGLAPRTSRESLVLSPRGTSSTPCTSSTTGRRRGSRSSPGLVACARGLAGLDALHAPGRGRRRHRRYAVLGEPSAAESAPGEPWRGSTLARAGR